MPIVARLRTWSLGALLVLAPAGLAAVLLTRGPEPAQVPEDHVPLESWPDGAPRVTSREWAEGGLSWEELCSFGPDGAAHGCGRLRDGEPWDGTFVDWMDRGLDPKAGAGRRLSQKRRYRDGQRHGTWQTFDPDGAVAIQLEYEQGRLASRKIRAPDGTLAVPPPLPEHLPAGTLPVRPDVVLKR